MILVPLAVGKECAIGSTGETQVVRLDWMDRPFEDDRSMLPGSSVIGGAGTMGSAICMSTTACAETTHQVAVVQFLPASEKPNHYGRCGLFRELSMFAMSGFLL